MSCLYGRRILQSRIDIYHLCRCAFRRYHIARNFAHSDEQSIALIWAINEDNNFCAVCHGHFNFHLLFSGLALIPGHDGFDSLCEWKPIYFLATSYSRPQAGELACLETPIVHTVVCEAQHVYRTNGDAH